MAKPLLETAVLVPRDPALDTRTDEWPEFDLTGVHVYLPGDVTATTSLLLASEHFPVTVIGQLEPPSRDNERLLLQTPHKKRPTIEIPEVRTFSYGQYTDGGIAIWAAGKAGWYTIRPARSYKAAFNEMVDAVQTFYFVADAYREPRRSTRGKKSTILPDFTAQELFEKYAIEVSGLTSDVSGEAAAKVYQHKDFLLSNMISGKENPSWTKNPLYLHLRGKFPEHFANIRRRLAGDTKPSDSVSLENKARRGSLQTMSSTSSSTRKRSRPKKVMDNTPDIISIASSSVEDRGAKTAPARKDGGNPEGQAASLSKSQPKSVKNARRQPNTPVLALDSPLQSTEPEISNTPGESMDSDEGASLRPQKGRSALRPKSSHGGKGVSRSSNVPDADEADPEELTKSPSRVAGKRKPKDSLGSERPPKTRNSRRDIDEGIDIPTSPSDAEDASPPSDSDLTDLPNHADLPIRSLNHQPDPVQEDTWVCALDGCNHKVYAASKPESKKLIREHYALHAFDDDERVQMVKRLQAPSLPVRHLMEKVKQQAKIDGFPGSRLAGTRFPSTLPTTGVMKRY